MRACSEVRVHNVPESATNFPVFVSADLDPSQFPRAWDGVTGADRKFELSHAERMLFNTRNGAMSISLE